MEVLGRKYDTDKITHHGYHRFYELFLKHMRNSEINMIEIGIFKYSSLRMWLEYFPQGKIYGIDINTEDSGERYQIFKGDQSNVSFLNKMMETINAPIDFINDDGSHVPQHQIITFNTLFPHLKDGGVYIIEDIETSYWNNGKTYGFPVNCGYQYDNSIVEIFKQVADVINTEFIRQDLKSLLNQKNKYITQENLKKIATITFGQNCIIITKKDSTYDLYDNRAYRFKGVL